MCYHSFMAIPSSLHTVFWDTNIDEIDLDQHRSFVIERVLEYGTSQDAVWLSQQYPMSGIAEVIQNSRRLSEKSRNYWGLKFGLWNHSMPSTKQRATIWSY